MHFIVVSLEMLNHFQQSTDINIRSLFENAYGKRDKPAKCHELEPGGSSAEAARALPALWCLLSIALLLQALNLVP